MGLKKIIHKPRFLQICPYGAEKNVHKPRFAQMGLKKMSINPDLPRWG
jgi:hypothetical protein